MPGHPDTTAPILKLDEATWDAILASSPLGRAALPEEVADLAVVLASSPAITGQGWIAKARKPACVGDSKPDNVRLQFI